MEDWKKRLREAREAKGLNKTEFARLVKVSNPTVTDWEKSVADGGIKEIAGVNLTKVATALGVSPHWLLHGEGAPPHGAEHLAAQVEQPEQDREGRLAESMKLKIETAEELRLLSVYRLANGDGRAAIDTVVEKVRRRLDVDNVGLNKR